MTLKFVSDIDECQLFTIDPHKTRKELDRKVLRNYLIKNKYPLNTPVKSKVDKGIIFKEKREGSRPVVVLRTVFTIDLLKSV